jgi:lipopolysaccharide biosynthesis glycosyltransferase
MRVFVGFDQREAIAYHVFCQSVIEHTSVPVSFSPLSAKGLAGFDGQQDGTNAFIYSRYLVPELCNYEGWALFVDGDMVVSSDLSELWRLRNDDYAAMVVKHDYRTRHGRKYRGTPMENDNLDYPRKNWSSVVLWNCAHPANKILSRTFVGEAGGRFLHRFEWLRDEEIGDLPPEWNHLVLEYENNNAKLLHHTLGTPAFTAYADTDLSWHRYLLNALNAIGELPIEIVRRANARRD